jgi:hypothetical protein
VIVLHQKVIVAEKSSIIVTQRFTEVSLRFTEEEKGPKSQIPNSKNRTLMTLMVMIKYDIKTQAPNPKFQIPKGCRLLTEIC